MKVAVIIAHTASGWTFLEVGEDVSAIKASFKRIKVAGVHTVGDEPADVVVMLDSGGNVRRKRLNDPDEAEEVDVLNEGQAAQDAALDKALAEAHAAEEGRKLAGEAAQEAVGVIASRINAAAGTNSPEGATPAQPERAPNFPAEVSATKSEDAADVAETKAGEETAVTSSPASSEPAGLPTSPETEASKAEPASEDDDSSTEQRFGGGKSKRKR